MLSRARFIAVTTTMAVTLSLTAAITPAPAAPAETGLWIVRLKEPSLAASQAQSGRVDVTTPAALAYLDRLAAQQAEVAKSLGERLHRTVAVEAGYRHVLNAIVIRANEAEAKSLTEALGEVPGVAAIEPDVEYELTTDASHDLIGSGAIWDGETGQELATRGEGVVVGILDSGINPLHPSFAATDGEGYTHANPYPGFLGVCHPAHPNHDPICNAKLVGAYSFVSQSSARDTNGHGSHTASTAAGNRHQVTLPFGGEVATRTVQGVAPRANLITYRVCIDTCPVTAILAGVNQAIADGVDVLNYSISGADNPWSDSVSRAFLEAFGAGIFVSASAGNSGPGAGTVAHTSPWTASVAATNNDRIFAKTLAVLSPPGLAEMVAFPGFGPANAADIEAELRYSGEVGTATGCNTFPANAFAGAIALIPLGTCVPSIKVNNAANAGAAAVILFERQPGPPVFASGLEGTRIPAASVTQTSGEALQSLATATQDPVTIRLGAATRLVRDTPLADAVAWFSSRGPSDFDLLAPNMSAPGVNILAAYRESGGTANRYEIIRGTSMASPHVAGSGALLRALHPDWSPARIRAALAGTANPAGMRKQDGTTPADPLDIGAGRIDLAAAGRVGLVLDESYADMLAANPATGGTPRTLNVPYLVNRQCSQVCSWTRDVTSVADAPASYTAAVAAPAGMTATVEPASFSLAPGATQRLTVTVNVSGSTGGSWAFADLRLSTSDSHVGGAAISGVHYPIAVIPVAPAITVTPTSLEVSQKPDRTATRAVAIRNQGNGPLDWRLAGSDGCSTSADLAWLDATPESGTVTPGGSAQVRITFDSTGQRPGRLTATLCVASNDPANPVVRVAVALIVLDLPTISVPEQLTIIQPAGTVTGTKIEIGNKGTAPLEWRIGEAPADVRRDLLRDGVLLVPNTALPGVAAFDPQSGDLLEPAFITYPTSLGTTTHIILNAAQDGFLVSSQTQNVVHAFGVDGSYQGIFAPIGGANTSIMGNIRGMTISPWGTLLVTSATGNKVVEFDSRGEYLRDFITSGSGGINGPWYVLFRETDVLVAASSNDIYRYDHNGQPLSVWQNEINFPQQLYRQANGNVLAAAFLSPNGVWELDPNGTQVARYTGVSGNRGVYPLGNGNILTTNGTGVHEIDRGSALVETELTSTGVRMISEIVRSQPCDEPGHVPWLRVNRESGTTPAGKTSEVTVLTDSTGLAAGVHEAHLCFSGNDPDSPLIGVPVRLTVTDQTCSRTITGIHLGPLDVSAGLTCLAHGSTVVGPISVRSGASLHGNGANVIGPLSVNGAARVELSGLRLLGPVSANSAAHVEVSASTVIGPVSLRGGTAKLGFAGNRVVGPVSIRDNVTGAAPITVAANTIVGPLACSGNQPPPTNDGRANTVYGPASGQCRGL